MEQAWSLSRQAESKFFAEGRNCWRTARADRCGVLIDGEEYFNALAQAIERATERIMIFAWAFDTRLRLWLGDDCDAPVTIRELFERALRRNPRLHLHVLYWDFPVFYMFTREFAPRTRFSRDVMDRVHIEYDGHHPIFACHHQKVIVIDDSVAFVGGIDCGLGRWDAHGHAPEDARRRSGGRCFQPYHDLQLVFDGPAVAPLCELVNERWRRVTGQALEPVHPHDAWPKYARVLLAGPKLAFSRTMPLFYDQPEVREIEALIKDAVDAAREYIYIENQYFTSEILCETFEKKLAAEQGPEIILVVPYHFDGPIETMVLGTLQTHILRRLTSADRFGRLRVVSPVHLDPRGKFKQLVYVHSKFMIVDGRFMTLGTANFTDRSLGFDSELNLGLLARDEPERATLRSLVVTLLAEHLDASQDEVSRHWTRAGRITEVVDALGYARHSKSKTLVSTPDRIYLRGILLPLGRMFGDPPAPLAPEALGIQVGTSPRKHVPLGPLSKSALACLAVGVFWMFALATAEPPETGMRAVVSGLRATAPAPGFIVSLTGAAICGILAGLPVSWGLLTLAVVLPASKSIFASLATILLATVVTYLAGALRAPPDARTGAAAALGRLQRHDLTLRAPTLTFALLRYMNVAGFRRLNHLAGRFRMPVLPLVCGSILAYLPSIAISVVFSELLISSLRTSPGFVSWQFLTFLGCEAVGLTVFARYLVRRLY